MSLKFRLLSFLSRNTLNRKHDVGILFTWAVNMYPVRATFIRQHVSVNIYVSGYKLHVRDTLPGNLFRWCKRSLTLSKIIFLHTANRRRTNIFLDQNRKQISPKIPSTVACPKAYHVQKFHNHSSTIC